MFRRTFWHSGLRNPFLGTANFFTHDVLRLRRGTPAARYINLFLVFGISGAFHLSNETSSGIPPAKNRVSEFFLMQAVGITMEDFIEWVYRVVRPGRQRNRDDEKTGQDGVGESLETWQKLIGYVWVISWFLLTTPIWSYQRMRLDPSSLFTSSPADGTLDQDQL